MKAKSWLMRRRVLCYDVDSVFGLFRRTKCEKKEEKVESSQILWI